MTFQFTKMVPVKSYQHIVEQIESAIVNGELKQGERLPAEMKLKDMFDTSRGSVREALRVLEQKGLVDIKTGVKGGAVVKEANTSAISDSMALLIRCRKISLRHLAEFRQLLEGYAAERAAEIGRPEEVAELQYGQVQPGETGEHAQAQHQKYRLLNRSQPLLRTRSSELRDNGTARVR